MQAQEVGDKFLSELSCKITLFYKITKQVFDNLQWGSAGARITQGCKQAELKLRRTLNEPKIL